MNRVVFVDRATIAEAIDMPNLGPSVDYIEYPRTQPAQVVERCVNAQAVITNKVIFDQAVLTQLPNLQYIGVAATGVNMVDLAYCRDHGITVTNVKHYGSASVAEHTFMMMLMLVRQAKAYQSALARGSWQDSGQFCFFLNSIGQLSDCRLGLIGTGDIAREVARRAHGFGMSVQYHSPSGRDEVDGQGCVSLEQLLSTSDIVSIHCPLTNKTHNLIDAEALERMKPSAILLNCARGPIVNEPDLLYALKTQQIAAAGLDVLVDEPPSQNDPLFQAAMELDNLLITPHIAWASTKAMQALIDQVAVKLMQFFRGESVTNLAD